MYSFNQKTPETKSVVGFSYTIKANVYKTKCVVILHLLMLRVTKDGIPTKKKGMWSLDFESSVSLAVENEGMGSGEVS